MSKPEIVISGISGRYPISDDLEKFKENLFSGLDMVTADDLRWPIGYHRLPARNGKVLSMDQFDRDFFGICPSDEEFIDPQDRLLMEEVYACLLDAGVDPKSLKGTRTGYYHGACYVESHQKFGEPEEVPVKYKTLVTRVPQFLELKGPILDVDTACGSGLSAFCEAFHAIRNGLCDQAIATASNTIFRPRISAQFRDLKMITKDGKCKCLDASADGYVRSEAIVAIFLQKSPDAKRIYAKLLNCRSNSDGYKEEGITFPSTTGQTQLLKMTYDEARIDPAEINYVEAHITGTKAGDPVETNAMYDVICRDRTEPLLVGCLKSNIGHTEGTSGLCAISKACIVFQTGMIPPNIHYDNPNMALKGLRDGKMKGVSRTTPFTGKYIPVNCFGFGGANTHLLLSSPDDMYKSGDKNISEPIPRLVTICGRTQSSVKHVIECLKEKPMYLTREFLSLLNDYSKQSPDGFPFRGFAVISSPESLGHQDGNYGKSQAEERSNLQFVSCAVRRVVPSGQKKMTKVALEFRAPDASAAGIFDRLKNEFPYFHDVNQICNQLLEKYKFDSQTDCLNDVLIKNVALQVAIVDLLRDGLKLNIGYVVGHSTGELACAYFDGIFTREQAITAAFHVNNGINHVLHKFLQSPKERSEKWISAGSRIASVDYFVERLGKYNNEFSTSRYPDTLAVEVGAQDILRIKIEENGQPDPTGGPFVSLVKKLGALYSYGFDPCIEKLYPAVKYPLPVTTPFLSPLIKWDHSIPSPIREYLVRKDDLQFQSSKTIVYRFENSKTDDAFIYDHKIDGRILFPASGYLMIVWSTLAKLNKMLISELPVKFENVKFLRATVMSESQETSLAVRINESNGTFEVKEGENTMVTGRIVAAEMICATSENMVPVTSSSDLKLEAKDIYKELRVRGYDYGPYFQGVSEAKSDGSEGLVVWRDIMTRQVKESMALETSEDFLNLWTKEWIPFVDSLFQLQLLKSRTESRVLVVPTSIDSITCHPEDLRQAVTESKAKIADKLSLSEASLVPASYESDTNVIRVKGLEIKGFRGSIIQRKKQMVKLFKYEFVPFNLDDSLDVDTAAQTINQYYDQVVRWHEKRITPTLDTEDPQHSLLRLVARPSQSEEETIDTSHDLLIGSLRDNSFIWEQQSFFKSSLDTIVYNIICSSSKHPNLDVLEVNASNDILAARVNDILHDNFLYNQFTLNYNLLHPDPEQLREGSKTEGIKEVIQWDSNGNLDKKVPPAHLIIFIASGHQLEHQMIASLSSVMKEGGFLMIISREPSRDEKLEMVLSHVRRDMTVGGVFGDLLFLEAKNSGLIPISRKKLHERLAYRLQILKKPFRASVDHKLLEVGTGDFELWLEKLKCLLNESTEGNIWLAPNPKDPHFRDRVTGILGFVKSLRLEQGGQRVRCIMDFTSDESIDLKSAKYSEVVRRDLVYNIRLSEELGWGSMEHFLLPEQVEKDPQLKEPSEHVYLKSLKPGDLSSLSWVTNCVPSSRATQENHVEIHFSPLNFKDVLFATGRLPLDAVPQCVSPAVALDSLLGLEFSGVDRNRNRVMGMVPFKALASSIPITEYEMDFIWPVPKDWSLEDAATVPVVYSTAIYALLIRGQLQKRESVLIHAGAGGVGLAAIRICLHLDCEVFTSVGSDAKRSYLLSEFSQLKPQNILNSRDVKFEEQILIATNGKGVDVVLNSLSEEKLQASLRCLATNGRFLEIGKVDFVADNPLNHKQMLEDNKSLHGVFLDVLSKYSEDDYFSKNALKEKKLLWQLMVKGMQEGYVRPLVRKVFAKEKIEDAFRFMGTGKHIGKVVIQVRDDKCKPSRTMAYRTTFFNPEKSYIVIGGLGGLGLELVQWLVLKGARIIIAGSRRGVSTNYQKLVVSRLRKEGVNLMVSQEDVTSDEGAKRVIEAGIQAAPLGVGGVFNSAVVYKDVLFSDQTPYMFEQVWSPKAAATLHLDKWSRIYCSSSLEHFVTFSSISAGRGNEGQTSYNFANSLMDSICLSRNAQGLPGISVQWGVIGDVGIVADVHTAEGASKSGMAEVVLLGAASQRVHSVFETFDRILQYNSVGCMASVVRPTSSQASGKEGAADLLKIIGNIVGLKDLSNLDPKTSLGGLGIDSLIAVEIKQVIERILGLSLNIKEIRDLTISSMMDMSASFDKSPHEET